MFSSCKSYNVDFRGSVTVSPPLPWIVSLLLHHLTARLKGPSEMPTDMVDPLVSHPYA